ncbi:muts domain V-domain-containing protein [Catenaria anguillulae PL171]|uniref:Muts domain V-domain-containing protein n=1 Tax=Catenaria anguillulae PL171 TaxID=765915 RepID=A0A1Y2HAK1_9FUNG|nr:muts domain V-domain-containing protein [Catenaria anguillulae PL171]
MSTVSLAAIYIPALHSPSTALPSHPPLPLDTPIYITITDRLTFNTDQVTTTLADFTRTLQGLCPSEIIVPPHYLSAPTVVAQHSGYGQALFSSFIPDSDQCITQRPVADFVSRVHPCDRNGTVGGIQSDEFQITRHAIMEYLDYVHVGSRVPDVAPSKLLDGKHAIVPRPTAAHLELFRTARRRSEVGTVISFMDETHLRAGRQVLRRAMVLPYLRVNDIEARASRVELLKNDEKAFEVATGWVQHLMRWADLESIINQITSDAATLPALYALRHHLSTYNRIRPKLAAAPAFQHYDIPDISSTLALVNRTFDFTAIEQGLDSDDSFTEQEIDIVPPIVLRKDSDPTYVAHVDVGKKLLKKVKQIQEQFTRDIEYEGAKEGRKPYFRNAAVVSHGQDKADVMGFETRAVIDIPATDWQRVPESMKSQLTVVGTALGDRLISVLYEPWSRVQDHILKQRRITRKLEKDLIRAALDDLAQVHAPILHSLAALIAEVDLMLSIISVADKYSCTRAVVPPSSAKRVLRIQSGFHPILYKVESISDVPRRVVPVDLELSEDRPLCILTGANMSGKSTVLRTVGVTAIMSQLGSFVPAKTYPTSVPVFDSVFTRFGAVDDLSRGLSTFHIEVMELGEILRKATPNSLVLIDELGRSTSIEDGTALACAIARELLNRKTMTLITTHFLDMQRILRKHLTPDEFERIVFLQTESELVDDDPVEAARNKARDGDGIYVPPVHVEQRYKLIPGMAKASHGLEVAKTADLPRCMLSDAFKVRELIEAREARRPGQA